MAGNEVVLSAPPSYAISAELAARFNSALAGGIQIGYPRIAIKASRWRIRRGEEEFVMQDFFLDVILLAANPAVSKTFYIKQYDPNSNDPPDCASDDGVTPNPNVPQPQSPYCAGCPRNAWGSKIMPNGKQAKACADQKHLALLAAGDLGGDIYALTLPPASLKELGTYVNTLTSRNINACALVTRLTFDESSDFPRVKFTGNRWLTQEEFSKVLERVNDPIVPAVIQTLPKVPRTPQQAAAGAAFQQAPQPQAQAPVQQAAPTPAPAPAPQPQQQAAPQPQQQAAPTGFGGQQAAPQQPAPTPQAAPAAPQQGAPSGFGGQQAAPAGFGSQQSVPNPGVNTPAGGTVNAAPPNPALAETPAQDAAVPSGLAAQVSALIARQVAGINKQG